MTAAFSEKISEGHFVDDKLYSSFFNGVLDKLREANPNFPQIERTKILLSHGTAPNAYAIGDDIIVLYVPLLTNLENESQLAYIISHEIAHNLLEHSTKGMMAYSSLQQSQELKQKTKQIKRMKYNRASESISVYKDLLYGSKRNSREFEIEADSLGFVLFKNAFPTQEYQAVSALQLLESIDKEKDSLTVPDYTLLFATNEVPFKTEWINNEELNSYKYDTTPKFWTVDSLKTHPDCAIRAEFIATKFNVTSKETAKASSDFQYLQHLSQYNDILGLYAIKEYGKSLYSTFLKLKEEPDNPFLRSMAASNLERLQEAQKKYILDRHLDRLSPRNSDSYNTFLYFIREIRRKEMNFLINLYKA